MAEKNPLQQLADFGQSVWLDNIRRGLITSGELKRMITEDNVTGVTANPTIFEKAVSGSTDYDQAIGELVKEGKSPEEIYKILIIEDITNAADIFRPVYDRTGGADGFISIEVAPALAHDTEGTIREAVEFWNTIKRPNILIKVPATPEGIPAIEELLYKGINVNITLIFAVDVYKQVIEAYLRGLERRVEEGKPVDRMASVASFFVSRVDTKADKALEGIASDGTGGQKRDLAKSLLGTTAINNSKMAYEEFVRVFGEERFKKLKEKGARVQRPLWASTSTKNPDYRDVMYIEDLIGPDTVNTMPPQTITAFKDHGRVARTIDTGLDKARQQLADLASLGISLKQITDELTTEGVDAFMKSFEGLEQLISSKRDSLPTGLPERHTAGLGGLEPQVGDGLRRSNKDRIVSRIWEKDSTLWRPGAEAKESIRNRLGWLDVASTMKERAEDLIAFAGEVRDAGYRSVVLLGMGGSSLAPEVINRVMGPREDYPRFFMLDSTAPGTIEAIERRLDPENTLFIVATKSGGTLETMSFYRYFRAKVDQVKSSRAGENFVAITDPGTSLVALAEAEGFRRVFLNMPDIGGRYSALSYFGMVPAALMGVDIRPMLDEAETMAEACASCVAAEDNPGAWLGVVLGEASKAGRNKITIITSPDLDSFGLWVEQLLAESTGKEGKGLVPVTGEALGRPSSYGRDRLFVYLHLEGSSNKEQERVLQKLQDFGQPVVRLGVKSKWALGAEFFRWEMAAAVAGHLLGINPFDEPNVKESKDNTERLLDIFRQRGALPEGDVLAEEDGLLLFGDPEQLARAGSEGTLGSALTAFFRTVEPGDYVALQAYLPSMGEHEALLYDARVAIRSTLRVATTFGYGPRFLHSTGQLHKGGPNNGLFVQITADPRRDLPIPGEPYSFGTLIRAQALGDLEALHRHGRRAIRLHIRGDHAEGVEHIREALKSAVEPLGI